MTKTTSTQAETLLPGNAYRKSFAIQNEDGTDSVYIKREKNETLSVSSTDHDWKVGPGGSLSLNSLLDGTEMIQSRFTVIASANTPRISFFESEDIRR